MLSFVFFFFVFVAMKTLKWVIKLPTYMKKSLLCKRGNPEFSFSQVWCWTPRPKSKWTRCGAPMEPINQEHRFFEVAWAFSKTAPCCNKYQFQVMIVTSGSSQEWERMRICSQSVPRTNKKKKKKKDFGYWHSQT